MSKFESYQVGTYRTECCTTRSRYAAQCLALCCQQYQYIPYISQSDAAFSFHTSHKLANSSVSWLTNLSQVRCRLSPHAFTTMLIPICSLCTETPCYAIECESQRSKKPMSIFEISDYALSPTVCCCGVSDAVQCCRSRHS